jgi:hypothetical protein
MRHSIDTFIRAGVVAITIMTCLLHNAAVCQVAGHPVISEVYGGGGNSGAFYTHDFIELYNPTPGTVIMTDWSVQYQTAGGSGPFSSVAVISGAIAAHGFFLIQCNPGNGGTAAIPTPDAVAAISMAAGSGKIALVRDSLPVNAMDDSAVVDFVGYGSANLYEGSAAAPSPGNTSSLERKAGSASLPSTMGPGGPEERAGNGWDTDDNAGDFLMREAPEPQNGAASIENPGGNVSLVVEYTPRWNLVSVPLLVEDPGAGVVFPGADSPLYGYDGGYHPVDSVEPGQGYWTRFPSADTVSFAGARISEDSITLSAGWNIVGSISYPVDTDSIIEVPAGHLETRFYAYDAGYIPAAVIIPGLSYWVKSGTGGIIILRKPSDP